MVLQFRSKFFFPETVNWFPGHMLKSLRLLEKRLKFCQAVLEVRDARCPVSSANSSLSKLAADARCRRLVFVNKIDLSDPKKNRVFEDEFTASGTTTLFGSTLQSNCANKLLEMLTKSACRPFNSTTWTPSKQTVVAIVGMPSTGKSSVINLLRQHFFRKGHAVKVASDPGTTKSITGIRIQQNPSIIILDTPGILMPAGQLPPFAGLKLALTGAVKDAIVGEHTLADFLLYLLNHPAAGAARFSYVQALGLEAPTDSIDELLLNVGRRHGYLLSRGRVNEEQVAKHILLLYRAGKLGKLSLDDAGTDSFGDITNREADVYL